MPKITTSFVDAQTLAITFEVGDKTSSGKIIPYTAQAGDQIGGGVVVRNGVELGFITGPDKNYIHTFDTFAADKAADFFKLVNGVPQAGLEENYRITIGGVSYTPSELFHKATIVESARTSEVWPPEFVEQHTVHIKLNAPLKAGESVHVDFLTNLLKDIDVTYSPTTMHSNAVHVTQTGFDPHDPLKVGFLSTWKGVDFGTDPATNIGNTVYKPGTAFHVVDSVSGKTVYNGVVELSQALSNPNNFWQNFNKTDVYKMDFSSVTRAGTYHINVDGVGNSYDFTIGENVWQKVFETSAHGMYEQRSGIAHTKEFTDWVRPRDHHPADGTVIKWSTATLMDTDMGLNLQNKISFTALAEGATDKTVNAWGGWHDAADWDRRIQHTDAINDLLTLAEMKPDLAKNTDLHIPESKNGIPDIIDEALWGLDFFKRLQQSDGGVGGGIEFNDGPKNGESSWTDSNQAYAYAPDAWSSFRYAGSAAKAAGMMMKYDKGRAEAYLASAIKAVDWAETHIPDHAKGNNDILISRNLAFAELYKATGDDKWNKLYLASTVYGNKTDIAYNEHMYDAAYVYAKTKWAGVDKDIQKLGVDAILGEANFTLTFSKDDGFMTPFNPWGRVSFTGLVTSPQNAADLFTMAHSLTGDVKWQKAMIGAVQFLLGANPMNQSYMTGVGVNQLREIMDLDGSAMGKGPRPGITDYGLFNYYEAGANGWWLDKTAASIPNQWLKPVYESWIGWKDVAPITEYTVNDTIAAMTKLIGYLAGTDSDGSTGGSVAENPPTPDPGSNGGGTPSEPTPPSVVPADTTFKSVINGSSTRDAINGTAKADLIKAGVNADFVKAGDGNDKVDLGDGNDRGYGGHGNDVIMGKGGQDFLSGESGNDRLDGGAGRDVMLGDTGSDDLLGGAGDDLLMGGAGKDRLSGGAGHDEFVFTAKNEGGDTITDFAKGDIIAFRGAAFGGLHRGKLAGSLFEVSKDGNTHKAGAHFVWDTAHHDLSYDSNGRAAGGESLIAHFDNNPHLGLADFMII